MKELSSNQEWEKWGARDPLYALRHGRERIKKVQTRGRMRNFTSWACRTGQIFKHIGKSMG